MRGVFDTTLCDKVCQWLATAQWFSPGTPVSSTNKTDRHNITEILLKVALNTVNQPFEPCNGNDQRFYFVIICKSVYNVKQSQNCKNRGCQINMYISYITCYIVKNIIFEISSQTEIIFVKKYENYI